jgi:hypothetical protein
MFELDPETIDLISAAFGAFITLVIFSYLLTDKLLFRWALALLVGCGIGYTLGLVVQSSITNFSTQLRLAQSSVEGVLFVIPPLLLGLLLCLRSFAASKRLGWLAGLGNISIGYLVGVGSAVAISGAILGTVIPQINASGTALRMDSDLGELLQGIITPIATITSLLVFSPLQRGKDEQLNLIMVWVRRFGRFCIVVALAVAFSGALTSALTALVVQVWNILELIIG